MPDAPLRDAAGRPLFLTDAFDGAGCAGFTLLAFGATPPDWPHSRSAAFDVDRTSATGGCATPRACAPGAMPRKPGTAYLLRPDGYVAARFGAPIADADRSRAEPAPSGAA